MAALAVGYAGQVLSLSKSLEASQLFPQNMTYSAASGLEIPAFVLSIKD